MKNKARFVLIEQFIIIILANLIVIPLLYFNKMLDVNHYFKWGIFWWLALVLLGNTLLSHRFTSGLKQEWLFIISNIILISTIVAYCIFTFIHSNFDFKALDWLGSLNQVLDVNGTYYGILLGTAALFSIIYFSFFDSKMIKGLRTSGLRGNGKLKRVDSNLENSRWMNKEEKEKIFKANKFSKLGEVTKDGVPVFAQLTNKEKDIDVSFNSPCHSIIIGSTGSGKTTSFVNPMIQLLAKTNAGSSMIITDPKGELFSLHSKYLHERGYDVKVIDLRDTYQSYRWNPLDSIWDKYQLFKNAHNEAYERTDSVADSNLECSEPEEFEGLVKWYEFNNKAYSSYDKLVTAIKVYKKQMYDEVYEDLNDLASILIPVENEKDPMWEKGARSITLAVLLAMLEDSEEEELGMTKDKFNFFNLTKILQNSNNDYLELRKYFSGRSVLSKAVSLSKQVCDAAETTRASYMSVVYEKITLFNDSGICALTSTSDFSPKDLADHPTALFLKIPDEKTTRHNLAAIFILDLYKSLIAVASQDKDLTLKRNVYFILDEFGNMPKIENFDKMITVGRSRKIWFNMVIQSYAQLNNVYGDKVADIVKGNCGIKMFIGSNDINTCKEYSELCGNITILTNSTSSSDSNSSMSTSTQTQVRPLIYPSELQRLNKQGDIGHAIVVTFGNYPLKTYFTPSFKVPLYVIGKMDTSELESHFFDETALHYDITARNRMVLGEGEAPQETQSRFEEFSMGTVNGAPMNSTGVASAEEAVVDNKPVQNENKRKTKTQLIKEFNEMIDHIIVQNRRITDDELIEIVEKKLNPKKALAKKRRKEALLKKNQEKQEGDEK